MSGAVDLLSWLEERITPERAVIARLWLLPEVMAGSPRELAAAMLQPERVRAAFAALGQREQDALARLQAHGGVLPTAVLEREFGGVREAEQYANPRAYLLALSGVPSPIERLYLLGFIQRIHNGHNRSYAIPPDLLPLLPPVAPAYTSIHVASTTAPLRFDVRSPHEFEQHVLLLLVLADQGGMEVAPAGGLNKASLLRFARQWQPDTKHDGVTREEHIPYLMFVRQVAEGAELLRVGTHAMLRPTHAALEWMRQPLIERARRLLDGWVASRFDELVSFSGLRFERAYGRDVARAKRALLRLVAQLPADEWFSFRAFAAAVKQTEPDYARPHGVYDTWGIVSSYARTRLDGYAAWDMVEGEQIQGIVGGSLGWLGLTNLGINGENPESFQLNAYGAALLQDAPPPDEPPAELLIVQPNFEVYVPPHASPYHRFQLGRVAARQAEHSTDHFRLTKGSIQAALERGIAFEDLEHFLVEASGRALPQNVYATIHEWASQQGQVVFRRAALLETNDATLMQQIRHDKRLRFPQAERLTDTAYLVHEGDAQPLAERLRKAGYGLSADDMALDTPLSQRDLAMLITALEFYTSACEELALESDVSSALRRRVNKLLPEAQLNRALQASQAAIEVLQRALDQQGQHGKTSHS